MPTMAEIHETMHIVHEVPLEDKKRLRTMSTVTALKGPDRIDIEELAEDAYKLGRETEAKRHQCWVVGRIEDYEHIAILRAMEITGFQPMKAAKILDIGKTTLYRKLNYFRIPYGKRDSEEESDESGS